MSANEENTSVVLVGIVLLAIWFVALFHAPLVTLLLTFLAAVVIGSLMNGGSGDGRHGRR